MFSAWNRAVTAILILLTVEVLGSHAQSQPYPDVHFQLYTPFSPDLYFVLSNSDSNSVSMSPFNPRLPTVVFIHGFQSDKTTINMYRDTYLKKGAYNFIAVDWVYAAGTYNYITAKGYVPFVGGKLANLLEMLEADHKLVMQNVTIVGHSLGK